MLKDENLALNAKKLKNVEDTNKHYEQLRIHMARVRLMSFMEDPKVADRIRNEQISDPVLEEVRLNYIESNNGNLKKKYQKLLPKLVEYYETSSNKYRE